jgi:transcription elongation GreA/GreB family factor
MVDATSVVAGVQERDRWRHRVDLLERSLDEVRERRRQLERQLRRLSRELARLKVVAESLPGPGVKVSSFEVSGATPRPILR